MKFDRLRISSKTAIILFLASGFQAFGMYHVHATAGITEGGIFGALLLLNHWLALSPAFTSIVLNGACYLWGWKRLGHTFILKSLIASAGYSVVYAICERFPPLWPDIVHHPFVASIAGALFIGIGAGICVRLGGATCGDDALAMSIHDMTGIPVQKIYLTSDLTVLILSLSYISYTRIIWSLLTVILSGQMIGWFQNSVSTCGT